jgi:cysteinyl-tRNA synthetase
MNEVLGVLERNDAFDAGGDDDLTREVESRIAARAEAKAGKDWPTADAIRDELTALGVAIKDGPEGTTWSRIVE